MQRLKAFRLVIYMTAVLFVAKPFFGFLAMNKQFRPRQIHTILVKSFSKRKPESLQDAEANVLAVHQLLSNPLAALPSSVAFLLIVLFPLLFRNLVKTAERLLSDILTELLPPEDSYILTGQLLI